MDTSPIIFIGTGRSGTSVISEIVQRHPDIGYPSQYTERFPHHISINLISRIFDNFLWRIHGQKKQLNSVNLFNRFLFNPSEAYGMWKYLLKKKYDFSRPFLLNDIIDEDMILFLRKYFSSLLSMQGKKRLSFKITGPSRIGFLKQIFPDAYFIVLNRKMIPIVSSFLKVPFWKTRGYDKFWWTGPYLDEEISWAQTNKDKPHAITAYQIQKVVDITSLECQKHRPRHLTAHYEQFVINPQKTIEQIFSFTNLRHDKYCFEYLSKNRIINRNKDNSDYFSESELKDIQSARKRSSDYTNKWAKQTGYI